MFTKEKLEKKITEIEDEIGSLAEKIKFHLDETQKIINANPEVKKHGTEINALNKRKAELEPELKVWNSILKMIDEPEIAGEVTTQSKDLPDAISAKGKKAKTKTS